MRTIPSKLIVVLTLVLSGCANIRAPDSFIENPDGSASGIERWRNQLSQQGAEAKQDGSTYDVSTKVRSRRDIKVVLSPEHANELRDEFDEEFALFEPGSQGAAGPGLAQRADRDFGLALSGGGPRSASVSIGVLKALFEARVDGDDPSFSNSLLSRARYVSTVSGGGYAAYWYFSQLLSRDREQKGWNPFSDCQRIGQKQPVFDDWIKALESNDCLVPSGSSSSFGGKYRYQEHLLHHRHLLFEDDKAVGVRNAELGAVVYFGAGAAIYPLTLSNAFVPGFFSVLPHHFANTLFDWSWNWSPFGGIYLDGIDRMYGDISRRPQEPVHASGDDDCVSAASAAKADRSCTKPSMTFADLKKYTEDYWKTRSANDNLPPAPVWIVNASGFAGNSIWSLGIDKDLQKHQYEFTPFAYGSGLFGYFSRKDDMRPAGKGPGVSVVYPADMEPLDAVAASGAAVDAYNVDRDHVEFAVRLGAHMANFGLGIQLSNPVFGTENRSFHRSLIFPFYYVDGKKDSANTPEIYLTDGGHTDNLGLFALVRRKVGRILVIDSGDDSKKHFDSLIPACQRLDKDGIYVSFSGPDGEPPIECKTIEQHPGYGRYGALYFGEYGLEKIEGVSDRRKLGDIAYLKLSVPQADEEACQPDAGSAVEKSGNGASSPNVLPCAVLAAKWAADHDIEFVYNRFPIISTALVTATLKPLQYVALRDLGEYLTLMGLRTEKLKEFLTGSLVR